MNPEHGVQLGLLGALREALEGEGSDRTASQALLRQLLEYSEAHFLSEQLLMRLYAYPAYEDHVQEHDRLIEALRVVGVEWAEGQGGGAALLLQRVEEWLLVHMQTMDEALEAYLAAHAPRPS